jgi:hypothetical protein
MPLREEEVILVREMIEDYKYAKRARSAGARMWSKGERMLVAVLGVLMLGVNVAALVAHG